MNAEKVLAAGAEAGGRGGHIEAGGRSARVMRLVLLALLTAGAGALAYTRGGLAAWFMLWLLGGALAVSAAVLLFSLLRVRVTRNVSSPLYAAGDSLRVELSVRHTSFFPVLWMSVTDRFVHLTDGEVFAVTKLVYPGWKRRFTLKYRVEGLERGVYRYVGTELTSGDFWGMAVKRRWCPSEEGAAFTVLPEARALVPSAVPRGRGAEEPTSTPHHGASVAGHSVRDYVPGDPVHKIHWKSTARRGELMTRVSEPADELRYTVCLDARAGSYGSGGGGTVRLELFEEGIEWAAGLLRYAADQRTEVGFTSNGKEELWLSPAARTDFGSLLRILAGLVPDGTMPLEELLVNRTHRLLPAGYALAVITPVLHERMAAAIMELRSAGRQVLFLYIQPQAVLSVAEREWIRGLERAGCTVMALTEPRLEKEVRLHGEYAG